MCRFPQQIDGRNGQRAVARPDRFAERGLEQFEAKRFLYQEEAATNLLHLHDENLSYFDDNGNVCVGKKVLAAFNKLTPEGCMNVPRSFGGIGYRPINKGASSSPLLG